MIELDASQRAAVELVRKAPVGVVTGGPGTGKTTILRAALDAIDAGRTGQQAEGERSPYELAAPTGKAAKRMTEAVRAAHGPERKAQTVHRLLGYGMDPAGEAFAFNARTPLETDLVVVDEASMLDVHLADALLAARGTARLIFVGDVNQLPSVGPGRVFGDLIDSGACPVARLQNVHRAAAESWVCQNAPRVLEGAPLELSRRKDFLFEEVERAEDVYEAAIRHLVGAYPDAQLLSPQRTGAAGCDALNVKLQARLNPIHGESIAWGRPPHQLRAGDRVIQTENNYTLGVFNGEVGKVAALNAGAMLVDFGDRTLRYDRSQAQGLELAYALTVHRVQGSEWPWVIVVCHSSHSFMLNRQLFYTAITRAKEGVILVGDPTGIAHALRQNQPPQRATTLAERLRDGSVAA